MRRRDALLSLLLLVATLVYFVAPPHLSAIIEAVTWWDQWLAQSQSNVFPNQRGLNVAVLSPEGGLLAARRFDTYLTEDSGFARFVATIPYGSWVIVAAQDDAATSLSEADIAALKALGGTGSLRGREQWSYILVGQPFLASGLGFEALSERGLKAELKKGRPIGAGLLAGGGFRLGRPLPVDLRIRSSGYEAGSFAGLQIGETGDQYQNLWRWLMVALKRT